MFDQLGIETGSVITSINQVPVNSSNDIDKAIANTKNGSLRVTGIDPQGGTFNNVYGGIN
jgi:S1-C subfamily serine protease